MPCFQGDRDGEGFTDGHDTICSADGCTGGEGGSWCRNDTKTPCPSPFTDGVRAYNSQTKTWGSIYHLLDCLPYHPPVEGWCEDCPTGKVPASQCQPSIDLAKIQLLGDADVLGVSRVLLQVAYGLESQWWDNRKTVRLGQDCVDPGAGSYTPAPNYEVTICPPGGWCNGTHGFLCPQYTYRQEVGGTYPFSCYLCDLTGCEEGEYIETSPMSYEYVDYGGGVMVPPCGNRGAYTLQQLTPTGGKTR